VLRILKVMLTIVVGLCCISIIKRIGAVGPPLWSSGQSSWLQIRRPGFDFRDYQKKKELVWKGVHSAS
jgi:hypothetical protein